MSVGQVVGLGLLGAAAGGALVFTGITPDAFPDAIEDAFAELAGSHSAVLETAGAKMYTTADLAQAAAEKITSGASVLGTAKGFFVIPDAGLTSIDVSALSGASDPVVKAAQALNAHFVDLSELTTVINAFTTIDAGNADGAKAALAKFFDADTAKTIVDKAVAGGGKLADGALSWIGKTPFEQSLFLSNAAPPVIGAVGGAGLGLVTGGDGQSQNQPGRFVQQEQARRQAALNNALHQNGMA